MQKEEDKPDVKTNCICMIVPVVLAVLLLPFSMLVVPFCGAVGFGLLFDPRARRRQIGRSILIGSTLGLLFIFILASQWP